MKLGVLVGKERDMEKAAENLTPEQRKLFDTLVKIRDRTTSSHAGEASNASKLLERQHAKLKDFGMEEVKDLLEASVNTSRAINFKEGCWSSGSSANMVQVSLLGEQKETEFFLRLLLFAGYAYGCYVFTDKRVWDGVRYVQLGFAGKLPAALDAAFLCITTADLAFSYVANYPSERQDRLSGFMEGISSSTYMQQDIVTKDYEDAEKASQLWFNVAKSSGRYPCKRKGAAFEHGKAAGVMDKGKLRKTKALCDK